MIDDPAVRSVRVAVALCERFAELLKGPSTVRAAKQHGALFGVSGNEEALSLRIGEVQQIYPEIWRHLDDARTAFAGRGIDVAAYDQIRASEGAAIGANVDVKFASYGSSQHGYDETVKSANFNIDGYKRAVKAYQALMAATPQIDWAGIAKAEAEDPNIKAFTRSTTTKRWIMFGLLAAVIASPFLYVFYQRRQEHNRREASREAYEESHKPVDGADRAKLEQTLAETRQMIVAARQAWPAAFAPDALAALQPSTKPCAYKFEGPTPKAAETFVKYGNIDPGYGSPFPSFSPGQTVLDQLRRAESAIDGFERRLLRNYATREDADRLRKEMPAHVLVFVIDKDVPPVAGEGTTYTPGQVTGRAFVFSVAQKQIVCTGAVDVRNPPDLKTSARDDEADQMLFRDLEVRIRQAIAANLRAI